MASHDKFFRALLQNPSVANALLRERLPAETVALFAAPPETLPHTFIDGALKERVSDVLFRVPLRGGDRAYVYCLVEHKRTSELAVMLQLLRYLCAVYERLAREFPLQALPAVVPLVVYNGETRWRGPRRFRELLWGTPAAKRLTLDFGLVLVDLRTEHASHLSRHATLRGGLTALKVAAAPRNQQAKLIEAGWRDLEPDPSTQRLFLHYVTDVVQPADRPLVQQALRRQREGDETMYSLADAWKAQGYRRGKKKGLEQGLEQGREQGREQGLAAGLRESVRLIVRTRFKKAPPSTLERIERAAPNELPELLERAVKAKRLSDLFPSA